MPNDEALRRLIRVAEIIATDTQEPDTHQRAKEILALARILGRNAASAVSGLTADSSVG